MVAPFLSKLFQRIRVQWLLVPALALFPFFAASQTLDKSPVHSLSAADPNEPNDSVRVATLVSYGSKTTGAEINPAADVDYFRFAATANDFVGIEVLTEEASALDVKVLLYDSEGNELVEGDRVYTGTERILYGIKKTGVYFVRIADTENPSRFPYKILPPSIVDQSNTIRTQSNRENSTGPYVFSLSRVTPLQPFSLSAGSSFDGIVPLRWEAPLASADIEYNIYRSTVLTSSFARIGTTYREDFIDTSASNDIGYFYRVTAVYGATGTESSTSNAARGTPKAGGFKISAPYSASKVNLDGTIKPDEWSDAENVEITAKRLVNPPATVRLYAKNDEQFLHIAIDDSNGTEATNNLLVVGLDRDNNNTWDKNPPSDEGIILVERDTVGKPIVRFYGILGDYPDLTGEGEILDPPGVHASFGYSSGHIQYELSIDITKLAVASTAASRGIGMYVAVVSDVTNGEGPFGGLVYAPVTYSDLYFATPPAPSAPTLASPASGTTNQPIIPTLGWSAVAGATSYRLQVSMDNAFTSFVEHDSLLTAITKQIGPLANDKQFFWRVSAKNFGGESGFSNTWNFKTIPVAPAAPNLLTPANNAVNQQSSVMLRWNAASRATAYHLQVAHTPSFLDASLVVDDRALTDTSKQLQSLAYNTTYYWRVSATNDGGASTYAARSFTTAAAVTLLPPTVSYPAEPTASTSYRMISFPGISTIRISDFVTGNNKTDWRVYRDMGDPTGIVEVTSTATSINLGEGVWLLRKGDLSLAERSVPMPQLSNDGTYGISLRQAWTIIGNPFDKTVQWSDVIAVNGLPATLPLYTYDGTFRTSTTLEPFKGYYFDNRNARLNTLKIPYPFPGLKLGSAQPPSFVWKLQLVVQSDINQDVENFIGIAAAAKAAIDELDTYKPPLFLDQSFLYFVHPEWTGGQTFFNSDFRPAVGEGQIWTIEVATPRKSFTKIHFLGLETVPAEYDVTLINLSQTQPVNLRIGNEYTFQPTSERTRFELIVGKKSFTDDAIQRYRPQAFEVLQNYPNPFNPTTTIQFSVGTFGHTSLQVFDVLGREVATLVNEERAPGFYKLSWDASGLPSGVYLFRMQAGSFVQTRKMILAK